MRRLLSLCLVSFLAGCSLVVGGEVDDLQIDRDAKRDVRVDLRDFTPHVGQIVDVQIVEPDGALARAHAVIDPLPSDCVNITFPRGAPLSANRVDFFADLNMNRALDQTPTDHSWRFELPEDGRLLYVHDVDFTNIGEVDPATPGGQPLTVNITGAEAFEGQRVVASVSREDLIIDDLGNEMRLDTVPGIYVLGGVTGGVIAFELTGVIDGGAQHDIELAIGDGPTRCRTSAMAGGDGLTLEVDLSTIDCDDGAPRVVFEDCAR